METRTIGTLAVSTVGIGCNNFGMRIDARATERVVHAALDAGITFFDTADVYGGAGRSEEYLGRALAERRSEAIIASKFGNRMPEGQGASPAYLTRAVEASLRRLGTTHLDLYQLHNPDSAVPIADTLGALHDLVFEGKVREIGCSNFSADQLREAESAVQPGAARFVSVQNEYSLFHREPEATVLPACTELNVAFLPYFPLSNGLLTGKYRKGAAPPPGSRIAEMPRFAGGLTEENLDRVERLTLFAASRGRTLLELAFSWLLARPAVASVIAGATSPEQVEANAGAAGWVLSAGELAAVDAIVPGDV